MSGWIKVDKDLPDTIRFRRVVRAVRNANNALRSVTGDGEQLAITITLGAITRLWMYADSHIANNNTLAITLDEINQLVGVEGFSQALPVEWLQVIDPDHVQLPDFLEHNGTSAKQRSDAARRQAEYRQRHMQHNVTDESRVTNTRNSARPDQTRPEETRPEKEKEAVEPERSTEPIVARETSGLNDGVAETVARVFRHWCEIHDHPRAKLDVKRRKIIRQALKSYDEADVCQAISGFKNSAWHMGQNDRNEVYDGLHVILRDAEQIDRGLKFYAEPPRTNLSAQTKRIVAATEDWEPPEVRHAAR